MKKIVFICCCFLLFCCNVNYIASQKTYCGSLEVGFKNNDTTKLLLNAIYLNSTIDSLQGIWISREDKNEKLVFKNSFQYHIYEHDTLKSRFIIGDSCSSFSESKIDLKKNGNYLVVASSDDTLCYHIDFLSKEKLNLMYNGRVLLYRKLN